MALRSWALKTPKDGATTTSLGDLLEGCPNLLVKKSFLVSNLNIPSSNQSCCSSLCLFHHFFASITSLQIWCRLRLDPPSPKRATPAHDAPMLWSIAEQEKLFHTKVDPQIFLHVSSEISDYCNWDYWTFRLPLTSRHKLITTSSWCLIIASL